MKKLIFISFCSVLMSAGIAMADGGHEGNHDGDDHRCHDGECNPPTKEVCFNVVCTYELKEDHEHEHGQACSAASTFTKKVTEDGAEVPQNLEGTLDVTCDGQTWKSGAAIFTDLLGSRIQSSTGPDPAVLLPRGALTSGAEGRSGGHDTDSVLEINDNSKIRRGEGKCFIWTEHKRDHE